MSSPSESDINAAIDFDRVITDIINSGRDFFHPGGFHPTPATPEPVGIAGNDLESGLAVYLGPDGLFHPAPAAPEPRAPEPEPDPQMTLEEKLTDILNHAHVLITRAAAETAAKDACRHAEEEAKAASANLQRAQIALNRLLREYQLQRRLDEGPLIFTTNGGYVLITNNPNINNSATARFVPNDLAPPPSVSNEAITRRVATSPADTEQEVEA